MCISYSYCSVLPKSYDRYPKEELRSVMNLFENLASKDGLIKSNDGDLLSMNKEHNNVDHERVKPYHVYLAIKTKDDAAEEEQTTDKRVQDRGIDYWLGGGRFGKRYYDYGLTKTRFGRSVDHIDLNEDGDN